MSEGIDRSYAGGDLEEKTDDVQEVADDIFTSRACWLAGIWNDTEPQ